MTMLLRSATDSRTNRAWAETMKPTSTPERGRHEVSGDFFVCAPMSPAYTFLHV